ncbi:hypothetical protein M011DRAFT_490456 [Sporormia fimetaria CBS 119925]|uniref:Rhodopsin domain-containing protein n=1 Tax=Sporormia fimetaria CBS 119925 TaxID=1340428 RepID=A0A6A6UWU5_9PLEO|nr:hypothetical protein M011DRAFT_490456 [Sporormia fimetaria CBS 119925]
MGQGFDTAFQKELASQSWTLYGIGMFFILLRSFARYRRVRSFILLAPDDWLMMTLVPFFYTALIVCLNVIATGGGSNLFPPEEFILFNEEDIRERIKGSKIVVISEQAMLNIIWTLKATMLFTFARMTASTSYRRYITYLSLYVAVGWVAIEITFFTACRPFSGYWGMPPPNPQCTTFQHYAMVQAVFNLSSDFGLLGVWGVLLWDLRLGLREKGALGGVFGMGVFVIVAAILTKVYNLSDIYSPTYMLWYVREASVAVYVASLPGIWPLLREHVRFLRSHGSSDTQTPTHHSRAFRSIHGKEAGANITTQDVELACGRVSLGKSRRDSKRSGDGVLGWGGRKGSLDSDERGLNEWDGSSKEGWGKGGLEVHVDRTIEVRRSWDDGRGECEKEGERFEWEGEGAIRAPRVRIEGPDGVVGG